MSARHEQALPQGVKPSAAAASEQQSKEKEGELEREEAEEEEEEEGEYTYPYQHLRAQSYTLPNIGSKPTQPFRRLTYDDCSRPELEDSAEGYDPYVRMDTLMMGGASGESADLRSKAQRATRRSRAFRERQQQQWHQQALGVLSEAYDEDFVSRDEFLGGDGGSGRGEGAAADVTEPAARPKVKPKVLPKPLHKLLTR